MGICIFFNKKVIWTEAQHDVQSGCKIYLETNAHCEDTDGKKYANQALTNNFHVKTTNK